MDIKSIELVSFNKNNVGWSEKVYTFYTGQKAYWHTHSHAIKCFNGIGKDITDSEIGQKMVLSVKQSLELEG